MEASTWVMESDRLDLIGNWFSGRAQEVSNCVTKAQKLAYGGLQNDQTPDDVAAKICALRRHAVFVRLLATKEYAARSPIWPADDVSADARALRITATGQLKAMLADVNRISELHTWISDLVSETDRVISDPVRGVAPAPASERDLDFLSGRLEYDAQFPCTTPERRAFAVHLKKVAKAIQAIEGVDSGDSGPGGDHGAIRDCLSPDMVLKVAIEAGREEAERLRVQVERELADRGTRRCG